MKKRYILKTRKASNDLFYFERSISNIKDMKHINKHRFIIKIDE